SILLDAAADLLVYGMGERPMMEIAEALAAGQSISSVTSVRGTVYKTKDLRDIDCIRLPPFSETAVSKEVYAKSFLIQYENTDSITARALAESYADCHVVQNPPARPLTTPEFDSVYGLRYERLPHPMYEKDGGVPAMEEVRFSIISCRGCFGGCHFCALAFHQGRAVQSRSHASILAEAEKLTWESDFKGYIHDVGGPTANFRAPACQKQRTEGVCARRRCLAPQPCRQLIVDHEDYRMLLQKIRRIPNVKKVFVRSGIRHDYLLRDKNDRFFQELVEHHVSGQLKVAPEHVSARTLECMGKPGRAVFDAFARRFREINERLGMRQYIVPYFMSSHPGCDLHAAIELAEYLRDMGIRPEQAQDFYPSPGTLSTCMYYTEMNPLNGQKIYVPKNPHEKAMQRALIQYQAPRNYDLVREALRRAGREDLIGFGGKCLIPPRKWSEKKFKKNFEKKSRPPIRRKKR
ncbi:MAG: YgiQ family radical SAM protein, partial [Clostridiales bacterium]|nr:YgiQ family radical SAM protein [Clostridiales bacterium]